MLIHEKIDEDLFVLISKMKEKFLKLPKVKVFKEDYAYTFIRFLVACEHNYKAIKLLTDTDQIYSGIGNIINRSSLDMVFNLILILSNPQKYNQMYYKAGWRQEYEKFNNYINCDFFNNHIEWSTDVKESINESANQIGIKQEEIENLKKDIEYFPTVPQIMHEKGEHLKNLDDKTKNLFFIIYQNFYGRYSEILHGSGIGLSWLVAPYFNLSFPPESKLLMKSEVNIVAIISILIMITEINLYYQFNLNTEIKTNWERIAQAQVYKDLFNVKYSDIL